MKGEHLLQKKNRPRVHTNIHRQTSADAKGNREQGRERADQQQYYTRRLHYITTRTCTYTHACFHTFALHHNSTCTCTHAHARTP